MPCRNLVVATALSIGAIDQRIYAAFVALVVASVVVTPTALRVTGARVRPGADAAGVS